jgi:site-specific recombinase XerD
MSVTIKYELNSRPKEDGTCLILLRVTASRKTVRLGTGQFVLASHWNKNANDKLENWIKKQADDKLLISTTLRNKFRKAQAALIRLENDALEPTAETVKEYIQKAWEGAWKERSKYMLQEFLKSQIELANATGGEEMGIRFQTLANDLKQHLQDVDIPLVSINLEFLHQYERFLLAKNERSTIAKKMKYFKNLLQKAIDYGYLEGMANPFTNYSIKVPKSQKQSLTREEMKAILEAEVNPAHTAWHARNIFALQYYCAGTRIGDMLVMRWKNVVGDRLVFKMGKTGKDRSILLSAEAIRILNLYKMPNAKPEDFIFPFLENGINIQKILESVKAKKNLLGGPTANVNKCLKKVAAMAGITKNISTHIARHSFARHALKATSDVYMVSRALAHTSLKVTEEYLESIDIGAVDQAISMTFDPKSD